MGEPLEFAIEVRDPNATWSSGGRSSGPGASVSWKGAPPRRVEIVDEPGDFGKFQAARDTYVVYESSSGNGSSWLGSRPERSEPATKGRSFRHARTRRPSCSAASSSALAGPIPP